MKDYKAIFDGVESTIFKIGSRKLPLDQIRAELEPSKHVEGRRFTDDEYYTLLVHIVFYSGFRAQTVNDRLPVIDGHFPNYKVVADYDEHKVRSILKDPQMIKHDGKVRACIGNAKTFRDIIGKHGSFEQYVRTLPPAQSDKEIVGLREKFRQLLAFLGERTAFHFMTDIGLPVLKPDRVIERIFKRLALVRNDFRSLIRRVNSGREEVCASHGASDSVHRHCFCGLRPDADQGSRP